MSKSGNETTPRRPSSGQTGKRIMWCCGLTTIMSNRLWSRVGPCRVPTNEFTPWKKRKEKKNNCQVRFHRSAVSLQHIPLYVVVIRISVSKRRLVPPPPKKKKVFSKVYRKKYTERTGRRNSVREAGRKEGRKKVGGGRGRQKKTCSAPSHNTTLM